MEKRRRRILGEGLVVSNSFSLTVLSKQTQEGNLGGYFHISQWGPVFSNQSELHRKYSMRLNEDLSNFLSYSVYNLVLYTHKHNHNDHIILCCQQYGIK